MQSLLLWSLVSHDPSEIKQMCWFGAQYTFLIIIINVENSLTSFSPQTFER